MKRVIVETPYAGAVEFNLCYLRACMHDCLMRGEAPFASHGLYTQPGVLRDDVPEEREMGIQAGFAWRDAADLTVVYTDLGVSRGMLYGVDYAVARGGAVEYRKIGAVWASTNCFGRHISMCPQYSWPTDALNTVSKYISDDSSWGR